MDYITTIPAFFYNSTHRVSCNIGGGGGCHNSNKYDHSHLACNLFLKAMTNQEVLAFLTKPKIGTAHNLTTSLAFQTDPDIVIHNDYDPSSYNHAFYRWLRTCTVLIPVAYHVILTIFHVAMSCLCEACYQLGLLSGPPKTRKLLFSAKCHLYISWGHITTIWNTEKGLSRIHRGFLEKWKNSWKFLDNKYDHQKLVRIVNKIFPDRNIDFVDYKILDHAFKILDRVEYTVLDDVESVPLNVELLGQERNGYDYVAFNQTKRQTEDIKEARTWARTMQSRLFQSCLYLEDPKNDCSPLINWEEIKNWWFEDFDKMSFFEIAMQTLSLCQSSMLTFLRSKNYEFFLFNLICNVFCFLDDVKHEHFPEPKTELIFQLIATLICMLDTEILREALWDCFIIKANIFKHKNPTKFDLFIRQYENNFKLMEQLISKLTLPKDKNGHCHLEKYCPLPTTQRCFTKWHLLAQRFIHLNMQTRRNEGVLSDIYKKHLKITIADCQKNLVEFPNLEINPFILGDFCLNLFIPRFFAIDKLKVKMWKVRQNDKNKAVILTPLKTFLLCRHVNPYFRKIEKNVCWDIFILSYFKGLSNRTFVSLDKIRGLRIAMREKQIFGK